MEVSDVINDLSEISDERAAELLSSPCKFEKQFIRRDQSKIEHTRSQPETEGYSHGDFSNRPAMLTEKPAEPFHHQVKPCVEMVPMQNEVAQPRLQSVDEIVLGHDRLPVEKLQPHIKSVDEITHDKLQRGERQPRLLSVAEIIAKTDSLGLPKEISQLHLNSGEEISSEFNPVPKDRLASTMKSVGEMIYNCDKTSREIVQPHPRSNDDMGREYERPPSQPSQPACKSFDQFEHSQNYQLPPQPTHRSFERLELSQDCDLSLPTRKSFDRLNLANDCDPSPYLSPLYLKSFDEAVERLNKILDSTNLEPALKSSHEMTTDFDKALVGSSPSDQGRFGGFGAYAYGKEKKSSEGICRKIENILKPISKRLFMQSEGELIHGSDRPRLQPLASSEVLTTRKRSQPTEEETEAMMEELQTKMDEVKKENEDLLKLWNHVVGGVLGFKESIEEYSRREDATTSKVQAPTYEKETSIAESFMKYKPKVLPLQSQFSHLFRTKINLVDASSSDTNGVQEPLAEPTVAGSQVASSRVNMFSDTPSANRASRPSIISHIDAAGEPQAASQHTEAHTETPQAVPVALNKSTHEHDKSTLDEYETQNKTERDETTHITTAAQVDEHDTDDIPVSRYLSTTTRNIVDMADKVIESAQVDVRAGQPSTGSFMNDIKQSGDVLSHKSNEEFSKMMLCQSGATSLQRLEPFEAALRYSEQMFGPQSVEQFSKAKLSQSGDKSAHKPFVADIKQSPDTPGCQKVEGFGKVRMSTLKVLEREPKYQMTRRQDSQPTQGKWHNMDGPRQPFQTLFPEMQMTETRGATMSSVFDNFRNYSTEKEPWIQPSMPPFAAASMAPPRKPVSNEATFSGGIGGHVQQWATDVSSSLGSGFAPKTVEEYNTRRRSLYQPTDMHWHTAAEEKGVTKSHGGEHTDVDMQSALAPKIYRGTPIPRPTCDHGGYRGGQCTNDRMPRGDYGRHELPDMPGRARQDQDQCTESSMSVAASSQTSSIMSFDQSQEDYYRLHLDELVKLEEGAHGKHLLDEFQHMKWAKDAPK